MVKKFLVLFILAISTFVFLPSEARAEAGRDKSAVIGESNGFSLFQRGRRMRGRNRNWRAWNRSNNRNMRMNRRGFRLVRQTYWRNGRRYTRTGRVYN